MKTTILSDRSVRRAVTGKSHWWFFVVFFAHYMTYAMAPFQREMLRLSEKKKHKLFAVMAFRGSGKSTIMNLSYVLWSILGVRQKKCILIISKSQDMVATHMRNIKHELEHNKLLRDDLGPFKEEGEKFGTLSIVLPKMNARIFGISCGESIRGIRHESYRPDLIICDDIEDSFSVASHEKTEEIWRWFKNEVIPAGDKDTQIIILGNLLHEKSFLMRVRDEILKDRIKGIFRAYPLLDDMGRALWPGKFPPKAIEELELAIANKQTWSQEYLLRLSSGNWPEEPMNLTDENMREICYFIDWMSARRKNAGDRIHSSFLEKAGFTIHVPISGDDYDAFFDHKANIKRIEEEEKEMERKSRPPTPEEIRAQQEIEATRIRSTHPMREEIISEPLAYPEPGAMERYNEEIRKEIANKRLNAWGREDERELDPYD